MVTALDVLVQNNFGDTRTGGLAGPLGLLIVVLLGIATVLLIRNMNARLRRLPREFPDPAGDGARGQRPGTDRDGAAERVTGAEKIGGASSAMGDGQT